MFFVDVAFIIMIVDFYKMEMIRFNIINWVPYLQCKKESLPSLYFLTVTSEYSYLRALF
jgi:hypothetical protein